MSGGGAAQPNGTCPNCGSSASDEYCARCGQRQGDLVPSLGSWLSEVVDELLLVEARLPRTFRALVWPPGELTAEWFRGRRASYVSPLRVYLLVTVPFFLVLSLAPRTGLAEVLEVVVGSMPVVYEDEGLLEPLGPLSPDLEADSAARSAWQDEFARRAAHNELVIRAREERVERGLGRVYDLLPLVVGILLVPATASLMRLGTGGRLQFVGGLILSLHAHAIGYLGALLAWPLGAAGLVGAASSVAYVSRARAVVLGRSLLGSIAFSVLALVAYVVTFLGVYVLFVMGLAALVPGWAFGSS